MARRGRGRRIGVAFAVFAVAAAGFVAWLGYGASARYTMFPGAAPRRPLAVVYLSGDMGFRMGLGPDLADRLAQRGVSVVGINALSFFATRKTPAEVAAILGQAERHALTLAPRVVVIGQSYGADMLQVGLAGLDPALRARIERVVLIVPETTVEYRASPSGVFGWNNPAADAMPTALVLGREPTLCVHGVEEDGSLCPRLRQRGVTDVALPGGHPMHRDFDAVWNAVGPFVLS